MFDFFLFRHHMMHLICVFHPCSGRELRCRGWLGLEGRKLLLGGDTLSSLHLAGVVMRVSVTRVPQRSF